MTTATKNKLYSSRIDLPEPIRGRVIELLNTRTPIQYLKFLNIGLGSKC